nr:MAG TPA: hypothetical protein [Caudoviricetes sp.]
MQMFCQLFYMLFSISVNSSHFPRFESFCK